MRLYNLDRSGNCYKIRLMLSLLGVDYDKVTVNTNAGENQSQEFLALNPRGQVPVLVSSGDVIWDSTAILVYLALRYGQEQWFPKEPLLAAKTVQWLAFEQNEGRYGLARARAISLKNPTNFATTGNLEDSQALGVSALHVLEHQLQTSTWLVPELKHPTIADIACYPYAAMAWEGGIDLAPYTGVQRWFSQIEQLAGYVRLPSIR